VKLLKNGSTYIHFKIELLCIIALFFNVTLRAAKPTLHLSLVEQSWEKKSEIFRKTFSSDITISSLAFDANNRLFISAFGDLHLLDLSQNKLLAFDFFITEQLTICANNNLCAYTNPSLFINQTMVNFFDLGTKTQVGSIPNPHQMAVSSFAFSPNGYFLALALNSQDEGYVSLYDLNTQEKRTLYTQKNVCTVAFSTTSNILASANQTGDIVLWDLEQSTKIKDFKLGLNSPTSFAFNTSCLLVAVGDANGTMMLYNTITGMPLFPSRTLAEPIYNIIFSPDDTYIAASTTTKLVVWERMEESFQMLSLP
jgi:WD40 repeat protein